MESLRQLVVLLPLVLPLVGKILLMIPFVPNKGIPFINGIMASLAKYWYLTFGTPLVATSMGLDTSGVVLAGVFGTLGNGVLSVVWGFADSYFASRFYESKRLEANKSGKTSWWEQGKRSMYK